MKNRRKNQTGEDAFLRVMVPDLDVKRKEIERIAHIRFHNFIKDKDMLTVALYAGHPEELVYCYYSPPGLMYQEAAEKAKDFHFNMDMIQAAAQNGYFEKNIEKLLELGESNVDYGAKLVQVFWCFMEHIKEHRLSKSIVDRMDAFIMAQGHRDGFILMKQTKDEIHERFFV